MNAAIGLLVGDLLVVMLLMNSPWQSATLLKIIIRQLSFFLCKLTNNFIHINMGQTNDDMAMKLRYHKLQ